MYQVSVLKLRAALLNTKLSISEGLMGSFVEMAITLWLPLAGPPHSFSCASCLHGKKYELPLEGRLQLRSHNLNQNDKPVISNNAKKMLSQLDTLLKESVS